MHYLYYDNLLKDYINSQKDLSNRKYLKDNIVEKFIISYYLNLMLIPYTPLKCDKEVCVDIYSINPALCVGF